MKKCVSLPDKLAEEIETRSRLKEQKFSKTLTELAIKGLASEVKTK